MPKKYYVVFEGRNPGIYFAWKDADMQTCRYSGARHDSYPCYTDAESEWIDYCLKTGRGDDFARTHIHWPKNNASSSSCGVHMERNVHKGNRAARELAEDTRSDKFIIQRSMQTELEEVCNALTIPLPYYTLHEVTVMNGKPYSRYFACVATGAIGSPAVAVGRFAHDDDDAKEDVAAMLIQKLCDSTGRKIRDSNYYKVDQLEADLDKSLDRNLELDMQLEIVNEELRLMKVAAGTL